MVRGVRAARSPVASAILGGLGFSLAMLVAFPPIGWWWVAPVAVVPLIAAAVRWDRRFWVGGLLAGASTMPLWLYEQSWTRLVSAAGFIPLAMVLSVYPGVFVWSLARVRSRMPRVPVWVAAGVLWTGLEFLRGRVAFDGYPWYLVAHPVIEWPVLASPATVAGTYAVGFLIASLGGAMVGLAMGRRREALLGLGVVGIAWGLPGVLLGGGGGETEPMRIGLVQTNLPQEVRGTWPAAQRAEDMRRFLERTREAGRSDPDLIVWPETMFPGYYLDRESREVVGEAADRFPDLAEFVEEFALALMMTQERVGAPMLVGARAYEGLEIPPGDGFETRFDATYNSSLLIEDGSVARRYDKMHLTPFGEVMPYISSWAWLERQLLALGARGMTFDLSSGEEPVRFEVSGRRVSTPICFEVTMPGVCRKLVYEDGRRRADVLVNMTNDGWFGSFDGGRAQHLLCARWRCVELGVPMVRAANTGISSAIDVRGRVVEALDPRTEGVLIAEVAVGTGGTVYGRVGDLFGWLALGGAILLVGWTYVGRRGAGGQTRATGR